MKKYLLLSLLLITSLSPLKAQEPTSWWGVRSGVTFSNISNFNYSSRFLTGYSVGAIYARSISQTIPIYIEGGLYLQQKGARDNGFLLEIESESRLTKCEIEIPILLGYYIPLSDGWVIQSFVGLYYSVALDGELEVNGESFDPFQLEMLQRLDDRTAQELQLLHRSDFGVRGGLSVAYHRFLAGISYDAGFLNIYSHAFRDSGYDALAGCFSIFMGYNF